MTRVPSPDNTLTIALSLARYGWHVFPVKITDTPEGRDKRPLVKWKDEATTDAEQIATWWTTDFPDAWIGVYCEKSKIVVVDADQDGEKDGLGNLLAEEITVPDTLEYKTGRGGFHFIYKAPPGRWTIGQGVPVPDVDIRAGGGLFIYYGPELTKKPKLAPAPDWALIPFEGTERSTGATVEAWLNAVKGGKPGHKMHEQARRIKARGTSHDTLLDAVAQVVKLATVEGKRGARDTLDAMRHVYTLNYPDFARHFDAAVAGSVDHWGLPTDRELATIAKPVLEGLGDEARNAIGDAFDKAVLQAGYDEVGLQRPDEIDDPDPDDEDDEDFAEDLATRVRTMRIDIQARRMLAAESYTGTEEISWEDLEHHEVRWLVEDLVAESSLTYLVARANTGKTFTFIDMVARMQAGLPWLGKKTRPAKTLIVLGEGLHGAIDRFRAWSNANGVPLDSIRQNIKFAAGANLNNDESIERLQRLAADCELIVIDTYAATSGIDKEDDAALASLTLNRAKAINPNAALFFTHHPRKVDEDTERPVMRGSGAMAGAADTVMTLYRDHTYIPDGRDDQKWLALSTDAEHAGKNRNAQTETFRGLYLQEVDGSAVVSQVDGEGISKADKVIRSHLTGPMTVEEFRTKAGISRGTALKYLKESRFSSVKKGGGPNPDIFSPTSNVLYLISKKKAAPDAEQEAETS